MIVGTSNSLRESLFGTAGSGNKASSEMTYYLVSLDQAEEWLQARFPDSSEKVQASMKTLAKLPDVWDEKSEMKTVEEDVAVVLPRMYAALLDPEVKDVNMENLKLAPDSELAACVGIDDDPYMGATVYLYLTIPKEQTDQLDIPKAWERLKQPKSNALYWKLVACYPEEDAKTAK
jgi:hypothetical protein